MPNFKKIREQVERVVAEVVDARMAELRKDLITRVTAELEHAPGSSPTEILNAAVSSMQEAATQADILKALLDGAAKFSRRCGLLVLRGSTATGWQARGFANNDLFKTVSVDCARGLTARVLESQLPSTAPANEFDPAFAGRFGTRRNGTVTLFPLVIKEKVAALLYADGGEEGEQGLDAAALALLVRATGQWVEMLALRRSAPGEAVNHATPAATHATPPQAAVAKPAPVPPPAPAPEHVAAQPAAAAATVNYSEPREGEDDIHNKARRFAKLLVDEIKLYNQSKVAEGRQTRDLYDRLKDDIDKSRATYDRRYGQSVTDVDYFRQELVRILADNDVALLGSNFPQ